MYNHMHRQNSSGETRW